MASLITITICIVVFFLLKDYLPKRNLAYGKLSKKQLNLLIGYPCFVICIALMSYFSSKDLRDATFNTFTNYKSWIGGVTDPEYIAGVLKVAYESLDSKERTIWLSAEFYQDIAILLTTLSTISCVIVLIKHYNEKFIEKFRISSLSKFSTFCLVLTNVFGIFFLLIAGPSIIELFYVSIIIFIVAIVLIAWFYLSYVKALKSFECIPSEKITQTSINQKASKEPTKHCPYCGEEILAVAKKCRYCGEWLTDKDDTPEETESNHVEVKSEIKAEEVEIKQEIPVSTVNEESKPVETGTSPASLSEENVVNIQNSESEKSSKSDSSNIYLIIVLLVILIVFIIFIVTQLSVKNDSESSSSDDYPTNTYESYDDNDYYSTDTIAYDNSMDVSGSDQSSETVDDSYEEW